MVTNLNPIIKRSAILLCVWTYGTMAVLAESPSSPADSLSVRDESQVVTGKVTDKSGEAVIGASVKLKGDAEVFTVTDVDGKFSLPNIPASGGTLQVSYVGFTPKEMPLSPGKDDYSIVLDNDRSMLDEVVVVGYATQKKVNLTGSVASIGATSFEDRPVTNVTGALAGLAAGLTVTNSGGNTPGYESQGIYVRGQGTLNNSAPLVVVDGMTGIALGDINPQDIENISVLKDAASAAIYGSRAANGVILVTTRHGVERAPRVTYSGNVSFETVAKRLNLVTDYADFMEIPTAISPAITMNGRCAHISGV